MSHIVHVAKGRNAWEHDTEAAIHHGSYSGMVHHDGMDCRTYKFSTAHDAGAFHAKVKAKGVASHMTEHESEDEAGSFDPAVSAVMMEAVKRDGDHYQAFDDVDEACEWAQAVATDKIGYCVIFCESYEEFRAGPSDELAALSTGCPGYELVAVYEADTVEEALIKRRQYGTKLNASRKRRTTMDANRRKIATNAKMWRMRNKSRQSGYRSLYDRPKSKSSFESVTSVTVDDLTTAADAIKSGKSIQEVVDMLLASKDV